MLLKQNFHIHSTHSNDFAQMTLWNMYDEMSEMGMEHFGVSDHLHTRYNLDDIRSCAKHFHDLTTNFKPAGKFHLGVEVSVVSKYECEAIASGNYTTDELTPVYGVRSGLPDHNEYMLDFTEADKKALGIEYVIGSCHFPLQFPMTQNGLIDDYYQQLMFIANHPLVNIVAHPWWSLEITTALKGWHVKREEYNWESFLKIPQRYFDDIGEAIVKNHKLAEINGGLLFEREQTPAYCQRYARMLQDWKAQGVKFSYGSDDHCAHFDKYKIIAMESVLTLLGFTEDDFGLPF